MKKNGIRISFMLALLAATLLLGTAMAQYQQGPPPDDQQQAYPPQQGGYPPDQGAYPQEGQYPPQQGGYPDQGGYPPQGQYPPQQGQYPPQQGGYPQTQQYPPQQGGYPQQNPYPQQDQQQAGQQDPSSRVVRLKYLSGSVSMQPGGVNDWVQAVLNRPLTTSDRIWTDHDSRAELTLDTGALRMNGETSVTFTNVNDNTTQIELDQGILEVTVTRLYPGEIYEIDTPNLAFTITKPGEYRFDVLSDADETWVTVRHGEGMATGNGPGVKVSYGQQARFSRGNSMEHDRRRAPDRDGFDDWCQVRDKREQNGAYTRYVAPGTIGAEDLDQYGSWRVMPEYGPVWYPQVAPGWAPYHYGHWVWIDPWGWTWVDDAPWGFAPFHYGRWAYVGGAWGWCPAPYYGPRYYARPVYAPALVAWVGGSNWGVSFGVGPAVGWFPLGWREPYYPAYRVSNRYVTNVNITNTRIVNVTNVVNNYNTRNFTNARYVNRDVPGAVIAVRRDAMVNAQPIGRNAIRVDRRDLQQAQVMYNPGAAPDRRSVLGIHAGEHSAVPPRRAVDRPVVHQIAPPPARRTVFADRDDNRRPGMGNAPASPRNSGMPNNATAPRPTAPVNPAPAAPVAGPGRGNVPNDNRPGRGNAVTEDGVGRPARNVPRPPSAGGAPASTQGAGGNVAPTSPSSNRRTVYTNDNIPRDSEPRGGNVAPTAPSSNRRTVYTNDNVTTPRTGPEGTPEGRVAPENPRPSAPPVSNAPATINRPESAPRAPQATEAPRNAPPSAPARAPREARPGQGGGNVHRPADKPKQEAKPQEERHDRSSNYGNDGTYSARGQQNAGYADRGSYSPAPSYNARGTYSAAPQYRDRGAYSPAAHSGGNARPASAVRSAPANGGRGGNSHSSGSHRG